MIINTDSNLLCIPNCNSSIGTVEDALLFGVNIIWNNLTLTPFKDEISQINTNIRFKTQPNHSLYLIPFKFGIFPQLIQTDWWVKPINLYCKNNLSFENGEVLAKAIVVLRESYTIKQMSPSIIKDLNNKEAFVNAQEYATRKDIYGDNTYQVLKYKAERNNLPVELQPIIKPNPRLRIV